MLRGTDVSRMTDDMRTTMYADRRTPTGARRPAHADRLRYFAFYSMGLALIDEAPQQPGVCVCVCVCACVCVCGCVRACVHG